LTNALSVGLVPVDLAAVGGKALSSEARKYVLFVLCICPTNALVCNKTLIQMSHIKTLKITPTCFDHQVIIMPHNHT
jgi:hypothetical protein